MLHCDMDDMGSERPAVGLIGLADPALTSDRAGARAARLGRMIALGLPVPPGVALDFGAVREVARGGRIPKVPEELGPWIALRGSAGQRAWGGPQSILNLGITDDALPALADLIGRKGALEAYRRTIRSYGVRVGGLDPEDFDNLYYDQMKLRQSLREDDLEAVVAASKSLYGEELDEPFPQTLEAQLDGALRAMIREWEAPTARMLREARGAPEAAGLGIVLQRMVFGLGAMGSGAGSFQGVNSASGEPMATGRYLPDAQGQDAGRGMRTPHMITENEREEAGQSLPSLELSEPMALAGLIEADRTLLKSFGDAYELQFTLEQGELWLLDAEPVRRSARAAVRIAVDLAESGAIDRDIAILRIDPTSLITTLHPQVDPTARRDVIGTGLAASPGAVTGRIYFAAEPALAAHAQGEDVILVRVETSPEDIRGMHSASAVLTVRGGMTSHAAVIGRGIGLPCVVGASDIRFQTRRKMLTMPGGQVIRAGETITVDGTNGEILAGEAPLLEAARDAAFQTLMSWADETRDIAVRANADTPADAELARNFKARGIGLCRTEHMFFEADRLTVMREMIFADTSEDRAAVLERLLPMQRADFADLFRIMQGQPVCIRLFDPPLHEFLPADRAGHLQLAEALDMPVSDVTRRVEALGEYNPMLGMRGVRLGITVPEIYDMQARAIFEATLEASREGEPPVVPEIMIPLVSANREVDLVKARVEEIAAAVAEERGRRPEYDIGVMVETPRGALRAGDLAKSSAFLSFGTNDLTQMTYGLSRDDAGRFMRDYVAKGVFREDPFHTLDLEGVGELVLMAANRGRAVRPDLVLGLCGEHGGDPESIRFCVVSGMDYVSCSPFRVPIARLAAAQATILAEQGESPDSGAAV